MQQDDQLISQQEVENRIFTFRGLQVMIDRDLAEMYGVENKRLNEQVKRNSERFPDTFRFQLNDNEFIELVANCDRFKTLKHSSTLPYAFTEQGIAMLSAVIRSSVAIKISINIMNAFVAMRKTMAQNSLSDLRIQKLEHKQLETDEKFERIFKALESKDTIPEKGIFFEGQVFDAYHFVSDLIRKATKNIVLIDNYVDDTTLTLLLKRKENVTVTLYTKNISKELKLDLEKHNFQYSPIILKELNTAHDRFLIIDDSMTYHIGASLKDLGKKWFAFSKMDTHSLAIFNKLNDE